MKCTSRAQCRGELTFPVSYRDIPANQLALNGVNEYSGKFLNLPIEPPSDKDAP